MTINQWDVNNALILICGHPEEARLAKMVDEWQQLVDRQGETLASRKLLAQLKLASTFR